MVPVAAGVQEGVDLVGQGPIDFKRRWWLSVCRVVIVVRSYWLEERHIESGGDVVQQGSRRRYVTGLMMRKGPM